MKKRKKLRIVIGDQNLSSWSMRPWLVLKASGLPFEQTKILLDRPDTAKLIKRFSPSGRVPVLIDGTQTVWDSLAICEYIAELAPEKNLWPADARLRAQARSYVAEMHSGFTALRSQCSMDLSLKIKIKHLLPQTADDISRILELWKSALAKSQGPFLFGDFGIVDAYYAPVVMRFISYGIDIRDAQIRAYMKRISAHPAVKAWIAAAKKEKAFYARF
jgi:glutathione S-transferase